MKKFFFGPLLALLVLTSAAFTMDRSTDKDIVDVAVEAGTFQTLVAAVTAAELPKCYPTFPRGQSR